MTPQSSPSLQPPPWADSSLVKFAPLDPASGQRTLTGMAENVGTPEAVLHIQRDPGDPVTERPTDEELMIARDTPRLVAAG